MSDTGVRMQIEGKGRKVERSPEQAAAQCQKAELYPTVPKVPAEPGRELSHRLPWSESPRAVVACLLALFHVCSVILAPFLISVVWAWHAGSLEDVVGFGVIAIIPGGFSLCILAALVSYLHNRSAARPVVEISAQPLWPGAACDVLLTFAGPLKLWRLDVAILCEESVVWWKGADADSGGQKSSSHRELLLHATDLVISMARPFRLLYRFTVPPGAMHSFEAKNNKVQWLVRVEGQTSGLFGVRFKHDYPMIVLPFGATT
jgi:hypothetical protein